jgi:hypothetical protein
MREFVERKIWENNCFGNSAVNEKKIINGFFYKKMPKKAK